MILGTLYPAGSDGAFKLTSSGAIAPTRVEARSTILYLTTIAHIVFTGNPGMCMAVICASSFGNCVTSFLMLIHLCQFLCQLFLLNFLAQTKMRYGLIYFSKMLTHLHLHKWHPATWMASESSDWASESSRPEFTTSSESHGLRRHSGTTSKFGADGPLLANWS